jgi:hypothetical protein
LLTPAWYIVLLALVVFTLWRGRMFARIATAALIVATMMYREHLLYMVARWIVGKQTHDNVLNRDFIAGMREIGLFANATSLYSVGGALLLSIMAVWGRRGGAAVTRE